MNAMVMSARVGMRACAMGMLLLAGTPGCALDAQAGARGTGGDDETHGEPIETEQAHDGIESADLPFTMWFDAALPDFTVHYDGPPDVVARRRSYRGAEDEPERVRDLAARAFEPTFNRIGPTRMFVAAVDTYRFGGDDPGLRFTGRIDAVAISISPDPSFEGALFEMRVETSITDRTGESPTVSAVATTSFRCATIAQVPEFTHENVRVFPYLVFKRIYDAFIARNDAFHAHPATGAIASSVLPDDDAPLSRLQDGNVDTGVVFSGLESEVVDTSVFGNTYAFAPIWIALRFDEPTTISSSSIAWDPNHSSDAVRGDGDEQVRMHLFATDVERPGAPSPMSPFWQEIAPSGPLATAGQSDVRPIRARAIAYWFELPEGTEHSMQLAITELSAMIPPARVPRPYALPENYAPSSGASCFVAGTAISTPQGKRAIERIRAGDLVWSYDARTGKRVTARVLETQRTPTYANGLLRLEDGRVLGTTPDHPFFVLLSNADALTPRDDASRKAGEPTAPAREFARRLHGTRIPGPRAGTALEVRYAAELVTGDRVITEGAGGALVEGRVARWQALPALVDVYNFKVEGTHAYFAEGVLVHNR